MRTEELKETYETLTKETSNLNMFANIDLWRERILEASHLRTMIDISEAVDRLVSCLINSGKNLSKSEIFQLQNTIDKLNSEYEELKNTDVFDRVVKRLSETLKDDKSAIILRTITQEEVDKMLDDASRIKMGDCSFAACDLFVVDFSEAYLNNRSIELLRKVRIFNLDNLIR